MTPSPSTWTFLATGILGADVNLQAGNIICNYRNERENKDVLVGLGTRLHRTGCHKFGALVRDHRRIGAYAVIAPGPMLQPGTVVAGASLLDVE